MVGEAHSIPSTSVPGSCGNESLLDRPATAVLRLLCCCGRHAGVHTCVRTAVQQRMHQQVGGCSGTTVTCIAPKRRAYASTLNLATSSTCVHTTTRALAKPGDCCTGLIPLAAYLVSPQQLVIRDIFDGVVRIEELDHPVLRHILAVLAGMLPAVRLAHSQEAHALACLQTTDEVLPSPVVCALL